MQIKNIKKSFDCHILPLLFVLFILTIGTYIKYL